MIEVVVTWLDPIAGCDAVSLSARERLRAARFRFAEDRLRYIAAHARLRELLAARAGRAAASLEFESGEHGKPRLANSPWQFNLSRSGDCAAYAFARDRAVGIDVEAIRAFPEADLIAARTFPRCERLAYAALPRRARARGFFRGWTRTEALAKALGGGLGLGPEALDAALEGGWRVRSFTPAPGFIAAIAAQRRLH